MNMIYERRARAAPTCRWLVAIVTDVYANVIVYLIFLLCTQFPPDTQSPILCISKPSTYPLAGHGRRIIPLFCCRKPSIRAAYCSHRIWWMCVNRKMKQIETDGRTGIEGPLRNRARECVSRATGKKRINFKSKRNGTWQNLKINIMQSMIPLYTRVHVKWRVSRSQSVVDGQLPMVSATRIRMHGIFPPIDLHAPHLKQQIECMQCRASW